MTIAQRGICRRVPWLVVASVVAGCTQNAPVESPGPKNAPESAVKVASTADIAAAPSIAVTPDVTAGAGPIKPKAAKTKAVKTRAVARPALKWPKSTSGGGEPLAARPLQTVFSRLRQLAAAREMRPLRQHLSRRTLSAIEAEGGDSRLAPVSPRTLSTRLQGDIVDVRFEGHRATVLLRHGGRQRAAFFFLEEGAWRLDLSGARHWHKADAGEARPANQPVSLAQATAGLTGEGQLMAHFDTSAGKLNCLLHERRVPRTVAHFVSLARGLRAHLETGTDGAADSWVQLPLYDGLRFHRVRSDHFIQTGDLGGTGRGHAGFTIADEFDPDLRHDRAGVLSLASAGPNTGSSQVLMTLRPAPDYNDVHTVFGLCEPVAVISRIASAPAGSHMLRSVRFSRGK